MNEREQNYLNQLFAEHTGEDDSLMQDIPLVDVPKHLNEKLLSIPDQLQVVTAKPTRSPLFGWQKASGIAACFLVVMVAFQFYQQQQTLKQLQQAQSDLATALQYLSEAQDITRAHVVSSLNENMKKAAVQPAVEAGRSLMKPRSKDLDPENSNSTRTL